MLFRSGKAVWRFKLSPDASIQQVSAGSQQIVIIGHLRSSDSTQVFFEIINTADGKSLGRTIADPEILTPGRFRLMIDADGLTTIEGNTVRRWISAP